MRPSGAGEGGGAESDVASGGTGSSPERIRMLYAGHREWFRSALEAVLEPEGFDVHWAQGVQEALDSVAERAPDLIIVDENVREMSAPDLCRTLRSGPLPEHVPIVFYTSDMTSEHQQAEALEAGAWEVIREPIRAESLVASLRRLLRIAGLIGDVREGRYVDRESGLLTVHGLRQLLPTLEAIAEREGAVLSCAVVGPTERGSGGGSGRKGITARLCAGHVRQADLCGWVRDGDVAIVAFNTPPEGATTMAHRLERVSGEMAREAGEPGAVISAGIVQLHPHGEGDGEAAEDREAALGEAPPAPRVGSDSMSLLATAQEALETARREGGGVRTAETE